MQNGSVHAAAKLTFILCISVITSTSILLLYWFYRSYCAAKLTDQAEMFSALFAVMLACTGIHLWHSPMSNSDHRLQPITKWNSLLGILSTGLVHLSHWRRK